MANDPAYLQALKQEARLAGRLDHPNITTVYDFQVEDGAAFIVIEYVPDALDKHISQGRRLPWRRAVEIALQVARDLDQAHQNGVVHRDIKPQNILLRENGAATVTDFGIARALAASMRSRTISGAPFYMAPEQWAGRPVDGRLDLYALGIVLYELITGRKAFSGDSNEALFVQQRDVPMPRLRANLRVPRAVESVIRRATEKNPNSRFASAGDMTVALERALAGSGKPVAESAPPLHASPAPGKPPLPPPLGPR